MPTISSTTVKNAMRKLSVVFSHAVELGFLENNPMFGVSVNTSKKMVEVGESKGYSPEDIKRLFKYQLFRDVNTPKLICSSQTGHLIKRHFVVQS
ncbi:hypothetical protein [Vibrio parahaemolyticus]|uniref:hypothetical protein n=1 Tax=Vibrio parahaemolyticus TaxID=670 RepID=UPI00387B44E9